MRTLLVIAAPAEARAALRGLGADERAAGEAWRLHEARDGFDVVVCGVGKANAAGATALVFDASRHGLVMSIGVAGALPVYAGEGIGGAAAGGPGAERAPRFGARIGEVILAERSVYADEGVVTAAGFEDVARMGFAPAGGGEEAGGRGIGVEAGSAARVAVGSLVDGVGVIATVSTCSGTDAAAREVVGRTGAIAEAMEGAAVGFACARLGAALGLEAPIPFGEVRIISNTTGERARQEWDLKGALARLEAFVRAWQAAVARGARG